MISNIDYSSFADILNCFVKNGCEISHNLWVHRQSMFISAGQEKDIVIKNNSLFFIVEDIIIFVLREFNFQINAGDLIIYVYESEINCDVIYTIKKNTTVKSSIADLKSHSCFTIPLNSINDPVPVNVLTNLQYSESELKKMINFKKNKLSQRGIYHAFSSDDFFTHICVSSLTDFQSISAESLLGDYEI